MAIAWVQMAITANAGGSVHHAILIGRCLIWSSLFPLPPPPGDCAVAGIPALAAALAVLMASGLLVTNEYYYSNPAQWRQPELDRRHLRLSDYMKARPASNVFCVDWGIMDSLRILKPGQTGLTGRHRPDLQTRPDRCRPRVPGK